ncbi:MAG: hypothetical protein IPG17_20960 [Sandaracinaceae bacterium]|nr:hypothetical protein [Sandaracinaceae bacterium]MBP7682951.1 hypothetical protein [Deltaproteobacteria bacterium]MBK7153727.1 hypothetical protein [Sandaracinaceae bacterium]MBK7775227.1 hypothetical protein [Sandaracinaceae bacterium]MBK8408307.1 hypothetical protein [Sandaracinaceae bacterium]
MAHEPNQQDYRLPADSFLATTAWKVSAALAVVGLLGSVAGFVADSNRFGYSYLFGFFAVTTLMLGAMFMVLIQHMTAGHWGVTSRRIFEVFMAGAPVIFVLALPILFAVQAGAFGMYDEWRLVHEHGGAHAEGEAEAEEHGALQLGASVAQAQEPEAAAAPDEGAPAEGEAEAGHGDEHGEAHAHTPQEQQLHHNTLLGKSGWLAEGFWAFRAVVYLLAWCLIALFYFKTSTRQDQTKDKQLTPRMQNASYLSSFVFGLTLTFASFDWVMSLEPAWYSTIFGVIIFGGSAIAILATACLFGIHMHRNNLAGGAVNGEHINDLSRLMFGFICFWTYVQFSQWMLIWYAGIPEEATWFHRRWQGGFEWVSLTLIFGHFVAPFFLLISRVQKRNLGWLQKMCVWLLAMHVVDLYWFVIPQANTPAHLDSSVVYDLAALLLCGGVFFTFVLKGLARFPLVPVGDPRLSRSLHHHQTY